MGTTTFIGVMFKTGFTVCFFYVLGGVEFRLVLYYFWVGGGMNDVVEYMRLHNARWKVGKVQQIVDGQSNVRSVCTFQRC